MDDSPHTKFSRSEESGFFIPPNTVQAQGSYRAIRELYVSATGFCRIVLAKRNGRLFVLKSLKGEYRGDPTAEAQLRKEFDCGFLLDSPYICRTLDFVDLSEKGHTIVMEYCGGETLQSLLDKGAPICSSHIRLIISGISEALDAVHRAGVVHRDIKPSNIIFETATGSLKLIDFGCADASGFELLKSAAGTRGYAHPDLEKTSDALNDFHAAGVTLQQLASLAPDKKMRKALLESGKLAIAGSVTSGSDLIRNFNDRQKVYPPPHSILIGLSAVLLAGVCYIGIVHFRQPSPSPKELESRAEKTPVSIPTAPHMPISSNSEDVESPKTGIPGPKNETNLERLTSSYSSNNQVVQSTLTDSEASLESIPSASRAADMTAVEICDSILLPLIRSENIPPTNEAISECASCILHHLPAYPALRARKLAEDRFSFLKKINRRTPSPK